MASRSLFVRVDGFDFADSDKAQIVFWGESGAGGALVVVGGATGGAEMSCGCCWWAIEGVVPLGGAEDMSVTSFMPFLNSFTLLPSARMISGSFFPKMRSATTRITRSSGVPMEP